MSDNVKWMLPEPAPEPAKWEDAKPAKADVKPSETHTGTDPLGRAVGPAEDHTKVKKVLDPETGKEVTPDEARASVKKAAARRNQKK